MDYSNNELLQLNRVCCYQEVMFYSDVFDVGRKSLDRQYLSKHPSRDPWTTLIFPQKPPPAKDF
jgi:hypothetical protein